MRKTKNDFYSPTLNSFQALNLRLGQSRVP